AGSGDERRAGVIGADVPVELVEACGWRPVRLAGAPGLATPDGSRYIGGGGDADVRSMFQQLLDGGYGAMAQLIIAHDFEGLARLYYALRALRLQRPDRTTAFPAPIFFDLLHMPWRSTGLYNRTRARQLRERLGGCSDDSLREAIAARNSVRERLNALRSHRRAGRITGVDALTVIGASVVLPPLQASALLDALLASLPSQSPLPGKHVFLTGSAHDHPDHYAAIEAAGAIIVGEDHDWGDRGQEALVAEDAADPLDALVDRYHFGTPASAKFSIAERARYTAGRARESGAEAVIAFVRKEDPAPRWDVPDQQAAVAPLPFLLLDDQPYAASDPAAVTRAVAEFVR
ncbi:MAG: 2-hydroxyacyl-CoA dehydratase, partial [Sphingomonadales bacterium]